MDEDGKVIGWQIVGPDGYNIHGDDADPFDLPSFAVLVDGAVETARDWAKENPGYRVVEVREGDVEEPEMVPVVSLRGATRSTGL